MEIQNYTLARRSITLLLTIVITSCSGSGGDGAVENMAPTASAGDDINIDENLSVQLSGVASDPEEKELAYEWVQLSGTPVILNEANTINPDFIAPDIDNKETLSFQFTATDVGGLSSTDEVSVFVSDVDPVAAAGIDGLANRYSQVTLDSSASKRATGFSWVQLSGPRVEISDSTTDTASFKPTSVGRFAFELTVENEYGSDSDQVVFDVQSKPQVYLNVPTNLESIALTSELISVGGNSGGVNRHQFTRHFQAS